LRTFSFEIAYDLNFSLKSSHIEELFIFVVKNFSFEIIYARKKLFEFLTFEIQKFKQPWMEK